MKIVQKESVLSNVLQHIKEYGGSESVEYVILTSSEYRKLCEELLVSDVPSIDGVKIVIEPEMLLG